MAEKLFQKGVFRMSRESAVAFYERLEKDEELQETLKELNTKERIEEYVKKELQYDFSLEEMQQVIFEKNPEITDEDLEAVVGGLSTFDVLAGITGVATALNVMTIGIGAGGVIVCAGVVAAAAAA